MQNSIQSKQAHSTRNGRVAVLRKGGRKRAGAARLACIVTATTQTSCRCSSCFKLSLLTSLSFPPQMKLLYWRNRVPARADLNEPRTQHAQVPPFTAPRPGSSSTPADRRAGPRPAHILQPRASRASLAERGAGGVPELSPRERGTKLSELRERASGASGRTRGWVGREGWRRWRQMFVASARVRRGAVFTACWKLRMRQNH